MYSAKRLILVTTLGLLATSVLGAASFGSADHDPPTATADSASELAPSLRVARCTTVDVGETFTIDIRGVNVTNLLAWEVYFAYNHEILELTGRDVRVFLSSQPGSNVVDFSDPVPNSTGLYRMAAADLGNKTATENGSGILAHVTMTAKARGVSPASIDSLDFDGDGVGDLGPTLTGIDESGRIVHLGDTENEDGIFDETIVSGQVAVDTPCVTPAPKPSIEDILVVLPSIATQSLALLPEEGEATSGGAASAPKTAADETPASDQTPEQDNPSDDGASPTEPPSSPGSGGTSDPSSGSGDGLPTWLIAVIGVVAAAAGLGLALSIAIIRSNRRPI